MKLFLDIYEISEEEARSGAETLWGTKLDDADNFSWQAPMLGDGGSSLTHTLAQYMVRYVQFGEFILDTADGPDECVFVEDGKFYHAIVTVE